MLRHIPSGILLAWDEDPRCPAIRTLSILYIELIRGVPLISCCFMSAVLFSSVPPGRTHSQQDSPRPGGDHPVHAAYIAEVVRGGLQAITRGQYEAAESLGLDYVQKMRLVVLPQALKIVIPPTVGILISAFKDTSSCRDHRPL